MQSSSPPQQPSKQNHQQRFSFYQPTITMAKDTGDDDGDINDLLNEVRADKNGIELAPLTGNGSSSVSMEAQAAVNKGRAAANATATYGNFSILELAFAYVTYSCEYAPKLCWTIGIILLIVPAYLLVMGILANPTEHFGVIKNDYSTIQSVYDFKLKDIDHWCLKGDNDSCKCEDPLQPAPRAEFRAWGKAHGGNVDMIGKLEEADLLSPDIAFLGGSVVEKMDGKWFGDQTDERLRDVAKAWNRHFATLDSGAPNADAPTAVALGIAGDTSPSVLWRLFNGEMPPEFNPKIWWLELGLNDLGRQQCSEEVVVMGVLRVVEEILNSKPNAKIVINSLFPMADLKSALNPNLQDLSDTYKQPRPGKRGKPNQQPPMPNGPGGGPDNGPNGFTPKAKMRPAEKKGPQRELRRSGNGFLNRDENRVKMDPNKKAQHKFNPITHKEKQKLPLWTSITAVNKQLRKFSMTHERVFFFDATSIFTEREGKYFYLKTDLITPKGIPTERGFDQWETAIVVRAKQLLLEDGN